MSEWASLVQDGKEVAAKAPPGWLTVEEAALKINRSRSHTERLLRMACLAGKWERKSFRIKSRSRIYPAFHYHRIEKT